MHLFQYFNTLEHVSRLSLATGKKKMPPTKETQKQNRPTQLNTKRACHILFTQSSSRSWLQSVCPQVIKDKIT